MNSDHPLSRRFKWLTLLLLLAPVIFFYLFDSTIGLLPVIGQRRALSNWPWIALLCGYCVPVIILLRSQRLLTALLTLAIVHTGHLYCADALDELPKQVEVEFGGSYREADVDVYCNEVFLGRTPFVMAADEFRRRVPVWASPPPRQPAIRYSSGADGKPVNPEFHWWSWTLTPGDPFEWPPSGNPFRIYHDQAELQKYLPRAPYWFRFEKDGCTVLRSMQPFSGGGGGGRVIRLQVSLGLSIPAEDALKPVLYDALVASAYQPDDAWKKLVLRYPNSVLEDLIQRSKTDPALLGVLDRLADEHFQLDSAATDAARGQVFASIYSQLGHPAQGGFLWLAKRTAGRIVRSQPQILVDQIRSVVKSSWGNELRFLAGCSALQREFLLALWADSHPADLFELAVYQHCLQLVESSDRVDPELVVAIGRSGRPEAVAIVRHYLKKVWGVTNSGFTQKLVHDRPRSASVQVMRDLNIPELEDYFWYLIGYRVTQDHFNQFSEIPGFIESRIERKEDREQLVQRIRGCQSLPWMELARLLLQVDHPSVGDALTALQANMRVSETRELPALLATAAANPALDQLLIKAWQDQHKDSPGMVNPRLNLAILRLDTPRVQQLVRDRLKSYSADSDRAWDNLATLPNAPVPGRLAHQRWLVGELEQAPLPTRRSAITILLEIESPEARELLQRWSTDPGTGLASEIEDQRQRGQDRIQQVEATRQKRLQSIADLAAGRIVPDSLIPRFPSAVWDGVTYQIEPAAGGAGQEPVP